LLNLIHRLVDDLGARRQATGRAVTTRLLASDERHNPGFHMPNTRNLRVAVVLSVATLTLTGTGLLIAGCSSGGSSSTTTTFPQASTTTSKLQARLADVTAQVSAMQATLDQAGQLTAATVSKLQSEVAGLQKTVNEIAATVPPKSQLAAQLEELSDELGALSTLLASGSATKAQVQASLTQIEKTIAGWKPTIPTVPTKPTIPTTRSVPTTSVTPRTTTAPVTTVPSPQAATSST
jgi:outer membrane murein-binding lipoprotein Lpp